MPSVLIETGFLTNYNEGSYLNSLNGQKEMSNAISKAIIKYKRDFYKDLTSEEKDNNLNYKIQISASQRLIETKSYNFNGLKSIKVYRDGDLYKYLYGNYSSHEEAKENLKYVKKFGFNSSFIVGFRNNKIISLNNLN